jgi:type VI secretion system secreted protein VgrG
MVLAVPRPAAAQEVPSPTVPPLPTEIPSPSIDPLPTETPSPDPPSPSPDPPSPSPDPPSPSPLPSPSPSVGPQPTDSPPPPPGPGPIVVVPGITPGTEPPTPVANREGGTTLFPTNTDQTAPSTEPKPSPTPELTPEPTQSVTESPEPGVAGSFRFPIPPREVIPLVLVGLALGVLLPILLWKAYRENHRPGAFLNKKRSYLEY